MHVHATVFILFVHAINKQQSVTSGTPGYINKVSLLLECIVLLWQLQSNQKNRQTNKTTTTTKTSNQHTNSNSKTANSRQNISTIAATTKPNRPFCFCADSPKKEKGLRLVEKVERTRPKFSLYFNEKKKKMGGGEGERKLHVDRKPGRYLGYMVPTHFSLQNHSTGLFYFPTSLSSQSCDCSFLKIVRPNFN